MKRSKKLFLILSLLFIIGVIAIGYDITTKTTFPGSKGNLKQRISGTDTLKSDSTKDQKLRVKD
ncbi:hypothetical protein QQ008_20425 [Fulvivirgaceae bacterium BMA10]|uniref:Uncharacterized protein n=1 Tax=Splendidivirga corallicola TaxID=3051826 RepID=A0ABT8KUG5_9BACT|nr:hypothetical protein [Fulvivirgaceae bacterium BMA10]